MITNEHLQQTEFPPNYSYRDLLITAPTHLLIVKWRLTGALNHARFVGNKNGQRVRQRSLVTYENSNFVQIELHDMNKGGQVYTSLYLVTESWKDYATEDHKRGGFVPGSADAMLAVCELEARLRHYPSIADVEIGTRGTHTASPATKPAVTPAPPAVSSTQAKSQLPAISLLLPPDPSVTAGKTVGSRQQSRRSDLEGEGKGSTDDGQYERFDPTREDVDATAVKAPSPEELAVYANGEAGEEEPL